VEDHNRKSQVHGIVSHSLRGRFTAEKAEKHTAKTPRDQQTIVGGFFVFRVSPSNAAAALRFTIERGRSFAFHHGTHPRLYSYPSWLTAFRCTVMLHALRQFDGLMRAPAHLAVAPVMPHVVVGMGWRRSAEGRDSGESHHGQLMVTAPHPIVTAPHPIVTAHPIVTTAQPNFTALLWRPPLHASTLTATC